MRMQLPWADLRRHRATQLTASIMQEIRPLLEGKEERNLAREIDRAIFELLWRTGADFITDAVRKEAGLEDRGNLGYTDKELRILEAKKLELMLNPNPTPFTFKPDEYSGDKK